MACTQAMLEFVRAFVISLGVDRNDAATILTALQNVLNRRPTGGATNNLGEAVTQTMTNAEESEQIAKRSLRSMGCATSRWCDRIVPDRAT